MKGSHVYNSHNEALVRTDGQCIPAWTERVERDGVTIWPRTEDQ